MSSKALTIKKLTGSIVELTARIDLRKASDQLDKIINELAQGIEVPGFRKGMAPKRLVIETVGLPDVKRRLSSELVRISLSDSVVSEKLQPISDPLVKIEPYNLSPAGELQEELRFSASFEVMPEVKLLDYRTIKLTKEELNETEPKTATEQDLTKALARLRYQKSELVAKVSDKAAKDDWVEISFSGSIEGVKQENLSSQNFPLVVGSGALVPGFEDKIVDMKIGETKKFSLPVAKIDKPVSFEVTLNQLKAVNLPSLDNVFAGLFGQVSLEALKTHLKSVIASERQHFCRHKREDLLLRKLVEKASTELPGTLVERELERLIGRLRDQVLSQGQTFEQYLAAKNETLDTLKRKFLAQAEYAVKAGLVLGEVARREKIDPADRGAPAKVLDRLLKDAVG